MQELWKNKRRITKGERQGLFSGLLFCADCGGKFHFATCKFNFLDELDTPEIGEPVATETTYGRRKTA